MKARRIKWQITCKRMAIRLSADFSTETLQVRREWHENDERKETTTKNTLPSKTSLQIWWRNQKPDKQKLIQHHQTSFTTNAKGTSLAGNTGEGKALPTESKPKTIKEMVIGSHLSIITLNTNGLNAPTKRHIMAGWMKTYACMHFHLPYHSAWSPKLYVIISYC